MLPTSHPGIPTLTTGADSVTQKKIFFPNLDGLRFFCFLSVFLFHTWSLLYRGIGQDQTGSGLFRHGNLGVNFFFTLSGYLITYLLIAERRNYERIHIPKFWMRRILRIWPLYFLCILLGFVIIPFALKLTGKIEYPTASAIPYLTFTSNFDYIKNGYPGSTILEVLWSIAVEEQFYFFWPVLLSLIPSRWYLHLFIAIALGSVVFRMVYTSPKMHDHHTLSCIGDMAIGAIGAWFSFNPRFRTFISRIGRPGILLIYFVLFAFFFFRDAIFDHGIFFRAIDRSLIAFAFLAVILEQNYANRSLFKFSSSKSITKLGVISYGLYCYHELAITGVFVAVGLISSGNGMAISAGKLILALIATIIIAMISYRFFESPFLRLKNRYAFFVKKNSRDL